MSLRGNLKPDELHGGGLDPKALRTAHVIDVGANDPSKNHFGNRKFTDAEYLSDLESPQEIEATLKLVKRLNEDKKEKLRRIEQGLEPLDTEEEMMKKASVLSNPKDGEFALGSIRAELALNRQVVPQEYASQKLGWYLYDTSLAFAGLSALTAIFFPVHFARILHLRAEKENFADRLTKLPKYKSIGEALLRHPRTYGWASMWEGYADHLARSSAKRAFLFTLSERLRHEAITEYVRSPNFVFHSVAARKEYEETLSNTFLRLFEEGRLGSAGDEQPLLKDGKGVQAGDEGATETLLLPSRHEKAKDVVNSSRQGIKLFAFPSLANQEKFDRVSWENCSKLHLFLAGVLASTAAAIIVNLFFHPLETARVIQMNYYASRDVYHVEGRWLRGNTPLGWLQRIRLTLFWGLGQPEFDGSAVRRTPIDGLRKLYKGFGVNLPHYAMPGLYIGVLDFVQMHLNPWTLADKGRRDSSAAHPDRDNTVFDENNIESQAPPGTLFAQGSSTLAACLLVHVALSPVNHVVSAVSEERFRSLSVKGKCGSFLSTLDMLNKGQVFGGVKGSSGRGLMASLASPSAVMRGFTFTLGAGIFDRVRAMNQFGYM